MKLRQLALASGCREVPSPIASWRRRINRTHGCIAVTDTAVDEIGRAVRDGTPIEIDP